MGLGSKTIWGRVPNFKCQLAKPPKIFPETVLSAMAFNEYILMQRKCLSICGYTFFLQQSALIETVIDRKCYFGISTDFFKLKLVKMLSTLRTLIFHEFR